jgi:hypothetical protein
MLQIVLILQIYAIHIIFEWLLLTNINFFNYRFLLKKKLTTFCKKNKVCYKEYKLYILASAILRFIVFSLWNVL